MLTFILAEAALETIPKKIWNHPSVERHGKRQKKNSGQLLLDRSLHHAAMLKLENNLKRGRPDIAHFVLLETLGSPLNKAGSLRVFIHTYNDYVIKVNPETRLPKNYNRFVGLIEQLFQQKKVPQEGKALLVLEQKTLPQLVAEIKPDYILGFSRKGEPKTIETAVSCLSSKQNPAVVVGGFAHDHFSKTTTQLIDETVCVDSEMLETWTITSRLIYEYERFLSLPTKRLNCQR
ncbi:MAG: 16S rRNA methyltransferase [Candidatus Bathyarchaeota archaeon]|nr:16S rRNA methyltransferase [Candidatus Bathyarchaeum tardum]WGM89343.1 MAG: 16S rRNA methyltransferase [Candidatus Bathyarchaeum tardum]WNZ28382.1 MAG: 16S rRNA methyltransferase [Candidatus Bathyarchaeota archaeon]